MAEECRGRLSYQESLFAAPSSRDLSFETLVRHELDATSWIDVVPGWLRDHDVLFDELLETAPWAHRQRHMWDKVVDEPRLVAIYPSVAELPPRLEQVRSTVSARYGVEFDSCLVNLYRDGRDSVAWHGDTVRKVMANPLVVTVSLGAHRRFLVRPRGGGGTVLRLDPGEGDLVVMGGAVQHAYEHTVPKEPKGAGARMSVTMRHARPAPQAGAAE